MSKAGDREIDQQIQETLNPVIEAYRSMRGGSTMLSEEAILSLPEDKPIIRDYFYPLPIPGQGRSAGTTYNVALAYREAWQAELPGYFEKVNQFGGRILSFENNEPMTFMTVLTKNMAYQTSLLLRDREEVCDNLSGIISNRMLEIQNVLAQPDSFFDKENRGDLLARAPFLHDLLGKDPDVSPNVPLIREKLVEGYNDLLQKLLVTNLCHDNVESDDRDHVLHDPQLYQLSPHEALYFSESDVKSYQNQLQRLADINEQIHVSEKQRIEISTIGGQCDSIPEFFARTSASLDVNACFPGFVPATAALTDIVTKQHTPGRLTKIDPAVTDLREQLHIPDENTHTTFLHHDLITDVRSHSEFDVSGTFAKKVSLKSDSGTMIAAIGRSSLINVEQAIEREASRSQTPPSIGSSSSSPSHVARVTRTSTSPSSPSHGRG